VLSRRRFLTGLAGLAALPAFARAGQTQAIRLAAAWQADTGHHVGVLAPAGEGVLAIASALRVPTRAHGLLRESSGNLLAVARRPGDWLLRWSMDGRPLAWRWSEPGRAFAGHVLASADGRTLYTTEIDLESGLGLIGVRDGASLEKRAEWPSLGRDPHMLVHDATHPDALLIANGGVPTRPETGRRKHDLARMDSSLVRLDVRGGKALGQWRLDDPRLSLRHLAWQGARLGIALQAEHDDPAAQAAAPVLALFDGVNLAAVPAHMPLAGYAGDIAAWDTGYALGCPRAAGVALIAADGAWRGFLPLAEACAAQATHAGLWVAGRGRALMWEPAALAQRLVVAEARLDNHWIAI